ncbi:MAG: hypothetical protein A2032_05390 [Chloroflexi bacterium RBG_19FT_COMBO_49_13]|nr:MAG: hypothetical protein A2032_05390 [Chloroflexi bacterium RBG_19FT_COMBO_49_13]
MFWYLVLAHLIADYPLQPTWMVNNKTRWTVLAMHVLIHYAVSLIVVGSARSTIWPHLLVLALLHLVIDIGKITLNKLRPKWVIMPYIVDQFLHFVTMGLFIVWIDNQFGEQFLALQPFWLILIIGYLLVTYVWYINERILSYNNSAYREEVVNQVWIRMITRATLLTAMLFLLGWLSPVSLSAALFVNLPYISSKYRFRILVTDLFVSIGGMLFIISTL